MELLALLSNRDDVIIPEVKASLNGYTVYPLKTLDELEDLYTNIPINLILIDTFSYRLSSLNGFLSKLNEDVVVLIAPEKLDKFSMDNLPRSIYDCIDSKSIRTELPAIVERALERQRFKNELRLLKQSREVIAPSHMRIYNRPEIEMFSGRCDPVPSGRYVHEKVIVNFAKML